MVPEPELTPPNKTQAHKAWHHRSSTGCPGKSCAFHLLWGERWAMPNYELLAELAVYVQENPACLVKKDYRRRPEDRWRQAGGKWKGKP